MARAWPAHGIHMRDRMGGWVGGWAAVIALRGALCVYCGGNGGVGRAGVGEEEWGGWGRTPLRGSSPAVNCLRGVHVESKTLTIACEVCTLTAKP